LLHFPDRSFFGRIGITSNFRRPANIQPGEAMRPQDICPTDGGPPAG